MATSYASDPKKRKREITDEDYQEEVNSDKDLSDDEDDGGNDTNDKYNLANEDPPDHAAFSSELEKLMTDGTGLIIKFEEMSRLHASKSEALRHMHANAKALCERPKPTPPTFAVVGVCASGKSELLNQVTGLEIDVMRTGSLEATTYVATVLQPPFPGQKRKFGVLIKFKTEEECRADLEDLLAQGVNNGSFMNGENEDEDTRCESMVYGSAAEDTLTSLFRTRPGFRSKDETRRTLNGTTKTFKGESGSDAITKDALLEKMLKWLRERWRGESRRYFETDCIEGHPDMDPGMKYVHTLLREYTTGYVETGEETSWPVVQEARVRIASRALELMQVVDLPGQNDINPIRNNAAQNYVPDCQGLWVIAEVNSAIDNQALHRTVSKYAGRFPGRLLVILTKTDIVDDGVLKRLQDDGVDMTKHDFLKDKVRELQNQLAKANLQLRSRETSVEGLQQVLESIRESQDELDKAEHKLYAYKVKLRNDVVKSKLQQKLERYLAKNEKLTILATSAKHYRVHSGTGDRCTPLMSVEMTEIPMVRKMAYEIAAPARFKAFSRYPESMRMLLAGVRRWTEGCSSEDDAGLADIAESLHEESKFMFAGVIETRKKIIEVKLLRPLGAGRAESRRKAAEELEAILDWNPQSFYSFFKKYGRHVTPKQGVQSWNENFLRSQTNDILDPAWHEMIIELERSLEEAKSYVTDQFDMKHNEMLQCQASVRSDTRAIDDDFKNLRNAFLQDCEAEGEKHKERFLTIKLHATKDSPRNYFAKATKPKYDRLLADSGKLVVHRTKAGMGKWFELPLHDNREPFLISHTCLENDMMEENRRYIEALQDLLQEVTKKLYDEFKPRTNHTPETPEEALARKDFKAFFDRHDSEILDLYERTEIVVEAGRQEGR